MDTDLLVCHIKTIDFHTDIADDVPARFDTSGYYNDSDLLRRRPLPKGLNKKVIGPMKDELGGDIMSEFAVLRSKLYSFRKINGTEDKKCKGNKKVCS